MKLFLFSSFTDRFILLQTNSLIYILFIVAGLMNPTNLSSQNYCETIQTVDSDGDGIADQIDTYTYDNQGNQTSRTYDYDGDGVADRIYTYTYDNQGNQTSYTYDSDGDGVADQIYTYTYDNQGNRTSYTYDSNGDGVADLIYTYTYDNQGNRTSITYDFDGDGVADRIDTNTYDNQGNQTSYTHDSDGDGVADYISTTEYISCNNAQSIVVESRFNAGQENLINIYPNPVSDFVQLTFNSSLEVPTRISLMDISGKLIKSINIDEINSGSSQRIEMSNLEPGNYILHVISSQEGIIAKEIIVKI